MEAADTIAVAQANTANGDTGLEKNLTNGHDEADELAERAQDAGAYAGEQAAAQAVEETAANEPITDLQDSIALPAQDLADVNVSPKQEEVPLHPTDYESEPSLPLEAPIKATTETSPRHSSRQTKPIDRFSTSSNEVAASKTRSKTPAAPTGHAAAAAATTPSKKRKSITPAVAAALEKEQNMKKQKMGKGAAVNGDVSAHREQSAQEQEEEDESLRLARELQGESFGLRRRKSVAG